MAAFQYGKLELTCAAMKQVVAEQVAKELKDLKLANDQLVQENARFVQENYDLCEDNARLRQENDDLRWASVHYRDLCIEAGRRVDHLERQLIPNAVEILRDTHLHIHMIKAAVERGITLAKLPTLAARLAEECNEIQRAERVLDERPMSSEGEEGEEGGEDEGGEDEEEL